MKQWSEQLQQLLPVFLQDRPWIILLSLLLVVLACMIWLWVAHPQLRLRRRVSNLGVQFMRDVRVPDGVEGELHIDYLVLKPDAILVVDVKHYDGFIYGNEAQEQWTQVLKQRNYHFDNPLRHVDIQIMAIKSVVPDANVEGVVLFAGGGRFPRHKPRGVMTLQDIPKRRQMQIVEDSLLAAWNRFQQFHAQSANR